METIHAPWRMAYIGSDKPDHCVFCHDAAQQELIVYMGSTAFVMLNRYPYTCGHLMVIPRRHLSHLEELTKEERREMFSLLDCCVRVLRAEMAPDGFNIGMNLGIAAGAGIEHHLHLHVVPRWNGDTNFMSVVGDIRVIPEDIVKTAKRLLPHFQKCIPEV
jgi:ATP adenylyltransferase